MFVYEPSHVLHSMFVHGGCSGGSTLGDEEAVGGVGSAHLAEISWGRCPFRIVRVT